MITIEKLITPVKQQVAITGISETDLLQLVKIFTERYNKAYEQLNAAIENYKGNNKDDDSTLDYFKAEMKFSFNFLQAINNYYDARKAG